jgi:acetyl/propionyl-CoA carboxylase alpha subunit
VEFLPRSGACWRGESRPARRARRRWRRRGETAVGVEFDPLLAKLVVYGGDARRTRSAARAARCRSGSCSASRRTPPLLADVLDSPEFRSATTRPTWWSGSLARDAAPEPPDEAWIAAALLALAGAGSAPGPRRAAGPPDPWDEPTAWRPGA